MRRSRVGSFVLVAALVGFLGGAFLWRSGVGEGARPTRAVSAAPDPAGPGELPLASPPRPALDGDPGPAPPGAGAEAPAESDGDLERALRWASVDLDALRREIPENSYWERAAPSQDPEVLEARARERARWNEEWGKIVSGNAREEEIHAYFAHRQRLSKDDLEFASLLLERYRDYLPESDVGLLELSIRMHHKRLQELPRELAEAFERKLRQDTLREAWLRDEARFEVPGPDPD